MASFDSQVLDEIRARIDLADFIEEHGIQVRRMGSRSVACCPFHKEKTPSFHIDSDKGFYKCFGCGVHGDIFAFMQAYDGVPFVEAVRQLAERAGVQLKTHYDPNAKMRDRLFQINQELTAFYRRCLIQTAEAERARSYLQSRGLSLEIQEQFQIGYAPAREGVLLQWAQKHDFSADELVAAGIMALPRRAGGTYYDRFRGRITFPICDVQGRVIAFSSRLLEDNKQLAKYVNSSESDIFKKSSTLYALQFARAEITKAQPRQAIVCEGQIDVIRCHACGFKTAVASQGTAFTLEHVKLLKKSADSAILIFDGDKAGIKAALRTTGLFLSESMPVRIVTLPNGEDPDSLLRTQGAAVFRECIDRAEDPAPYIVKMLRLQERAPDAMDATNRMAKILISTILDCPDPILTAKFLQDSAVALGLPNASLETELTRARTQRDDMAARKVAYQQRREGVENQQPNVQVAVEPQPDPMLEPEAFERIDAADEFIVDDGSEGSAQAIEPVQEPMVSAASRMDLQASRNLAESLCELLAHYFTDAEVMSCLFQHLPPTFVHDPYAYKMYDLACQATLNKSGSLSPDESDPDFVAFLGKLFIAPNRILADEETSPVLFAQQLIRRYWLREYERRCKQLSTDDPEQVQILLSCHRLRALPWEDAAMYMNALNAQALSQALSIPPETTLPQTPISVKKVDAESSPAEVVESATESATDAVSAEVVVPPQEEEVNFYDTL